MKILITGAAGFLGYHLVKKLEKEHTLTLVDIAPFDPKEYKESHTKLTLDIRNKHALSRAIDGQDIVIHAAAALPLWKDEDIITTNVQGTRNVLSCVKKHNIKRLIYISSTAVYGVPKKHPVMEDDPMVGVGTYGHTKIEAEKSCNRFIKQGVPVTILRPKTFVGTGRLGVFEILFDWIHDGKRIPVIGSGNNRYQLLDVDDLVDAIDKIIKSRSYRLNDAFNVGAVEFGTVREDLTNLFKAAKSGSKVQPTPSWLVKKALWIFEKMNISPLYQWVYDTADKDSFVSVDKLSKTIRWQPKYSNSDALIKSYKWYLKHYKEVKSHDSGVTHRVGWNQGILKAIKKVM